jgi:hypothetical protein
MNTNLFVSNLLRQIENLSFDDEEIFYKQIWMKYEYFSVSSFLAYNLYTSISFNIMARNREEVYQKILYHLKSEKIVLKPFITIPKFSSSICCKICRKEISNMCNLKNLPCEHEHNDYEPTEQELLAYVKELFFVADVSNEIISIHFNNKVANSISKLSITCLWKLIDQLDDYEDEKVFFNYILQKFRPRELVFDQPPYYFPIKIRALVRNDEELYEKLYKNTEFKTRQLLPHVTHLASEEEKSITDALELELYQLMNSNNMHCNICDIICSSAREHIHENKIYTHEQYLEYVKLNSKIKDLNIRMSLVDIIYK